MKKLQKLTLKELKSELSVLTKNENQQVAGGGNWEYFNGQWTYMLDEVEVYGSCSYSEIDAVTALENNANSASTGYCAKYVRMALEAGGLDTSGRPVSACDYANYLPQIGFQMIDNSNYQPQMGDIVVFDGSSNHTHGHIQMYNGTEWISDFVQNGFYPGTGYNTESTYWIYRSY